MTARLMAASTAELCPALNPEVTPGLTPSLPVRVPAWVSGCRPPVGAVRGRVGEIPSYVLAMGAH